MNDKADTAIFLDPIVSDWRFSWLFNDESQCLLQFWVVEYRSDGTSRFENLYAWALPGESRPPGWRSANLAPWRAIAPSGPQYRIVALEFVGSSREATAILRSLAQGDDLETSAQNAGVTAPPKAGALLLTAHRIAEPTTIYYSGSRSGSENRGTSPTRTAGAWVHPLSRLGIADIWSFDSIDVLETDSVARSCLELISAETGLRFTGADAHRIGSVEVYSSSVLPSEPSQVAVSTIRSPDGSGVAGMSVKILSPALANAFRLTVRCRLELAGEIVFDSIAEATGAPNPVVNFESGTDFGTYEVTLWVTHSPSTPPVIWHAESGAILRRVQIAIGLRGPDAMLTSSWLEKLSASRVGNRAQALKKIQSVSYETVQSGDEACWEQVRQEGREIASALFPKGSSSRFLPKGWSEEGPGKLVFSEWFASLSSRHHSGSLVMLDPYFDVDGIELVARVPTRDLKCVVLTCTQIKSRDDGSHAEPRVRRLKSATERIAFILRRKALDILDLRSNEQSNAELFHDRYLLVADSAGNYVEGFQLSNSVQGATKKSPLLITSIPADVLPQVGGYVDKLATASSEVVHDARVVSLYSSSEHTRPGPVDTEPPRKLGELWGMVLQDPSLATLDPAPLADALRHVNLLKKDGDFHFLPSTALVDDGFKRVAVSLRQADADEVWALWAAVAYVCYRITTFEALLEALLEGYPGLGSALEDVMRTAADQPWPEGLKGSEPSLEDLNLGGLTKLDFSDLVHEVRKLWNHPPFGRLRTVYPPRIAVWALLKCPIQHLDSALADLRARIPETVTDPKDLAVLSTASLVVAEVVECLQWGNGHQTAITLLTCDTPVLRALGTAGICARISDLDNVDEVIELLLPLSAGDKILALAECAYDLRITANRAGAESTSLSSARRRVYQEIVRTWPATWERDELESIVARLSGPLVGTAAVDMHNEFVVPLVAAHPNLESEAEEMWMHMWFKRIGIGGPAGGADTFSRGSDGMLTAVAAFTFAQSTSAHVESWKSEVDRHVRMWLRVVRRAFAKSNSHRDWASANSALVWCSTFADIALSHAQDDGRRHFLTDVLERCHAGNIESVVNEGLTEFVEQVASGAFRPATSTDADVSR